MSPPSETTRSSRPPGCPASWECECASSRSSIVPTVPGARISGSLMPTSPENRRGMSGSMRTTSSSCTTRRWPNTSAPICSRSVVRWFVPTLGSRVGALSRPRCEPSIRAPSRTTATNTRRIASPGGTRSTYQLERLYPTGTWDIHLGRIAPVVARHARPFVFLEAGCPSRDTSPARPNDWSLPGAPSGAAQADYLDELLGVVDATSWVQGAALSGLAGHAVRGKHRRHNTDYCMFAKPGAEVVARHFSQQQEPS